MTSIVATASSLDRRTPSTRLECPRRGRYLWDASLIFTENGHHLDAFGISTRRNGEVHLLWDEAQPSSSQSSVKWHRTAKSFHSDCLREFGSIGLLPGHGSMGERAGQSGSIGNRHHCSPTTANGSQPARRVTIQLRGNDCPGPARS